VPLPAGEPVRLWRGAGCADCNRTGYRGRQGIFEVMSLNDEIRVLNDRLAVLTHQRDFLNKITIASQESIARELRTQKPSADDWGKLLGFFDAEFSKLDAESRQIDGKRTTLQEKLEAVEKELASAGGNPEKIEKLITVVFDVQRGGSLAIEASYLISQAGWTPTYDIRVSSADTMVELTYAAFVRQNTGEDWRDIQMTLSTAQPALGGTPPELQPWYVSVAPQIRGGRAEVEWRCWMSQHPRGEPRCCGKTGLCRPASPPLHPSPFRRRK